MPTVLRIGAFRFFFYAGDGNEPHHIHIERDDKVAKFWLNPIRLQRSGRFSRKEIRQIHDIIETNHSAIMEAWNDYFSS